MRRLAADTRRCVGEKRRRHQRVRSTRRTEGRCLLAPRASDQRIDMLTADHTTSGRRLISEIEIGNLFRRANAGIKTRFQRTCSRRRRAHALQRRTNLRNERSSFVVCNVYRYHHHRYHQGLKNPFLCPRGRVALSCERVAHGGRTNASCGPFAQ